MPFIASTSGKLGDLRLKNRLFIPAHATGLFDERGRSTERALEYYARRIKGGAALVFLGETLVQKDGESWGIPISQDENCLFYEAMRALAVEHDCVVFDQFSHQGGQVWWAPGVVARGPSPVPQPISGVRPIAVGLAEIAKFRANFIQAARRAKACGIHGCEIKADQGKLLYQFLSRRYNHRTDAYGGTLRNRVRLLAEILSEIRTELGSFCLGVRLAVDSGYAADDSHPDITADETEEVIHCLREQSLIDYINLSVATNVWPHGYWAAHADLTRDLKPAELSVQKIRQKVGLPVLYAGQFRSFGDGESALQAGVCDFAGFARAHIADPDFTRKSLGVDARLVRPCIRCNQGCVGNTWEGRGVTCIINPTTGSPERLSRTKGAATAGAILIIGAGPAGLECALRAAEAGFSVVLAEAADQIGGRLRLAASVIASADWQKLIDYYRDELTRQPLVQIHLNCRVSNPDTLGKFDHIVYAGGRVAHTCPFFGTTETSAVCLVDVAWSRLQQMGGQRILVVDEDPYQGTLAFAEMAAKRGAIVKVITTQEFVGKGLDQVSLAARLSELRLAGVSCVPHTEIARLNPGTAVLRCVCSGQEESEQFDLVVFGTPPLHLEIPQAIANDPRAVILGDAVFPRGVEFALQDAEHFISQLQKTSAP